MSGITNILLAGVGGQGIVLGGDLLAGAALNSGLDVKKSDVFGMAQRGGSVTSAVRIGQGIRSPLPAVGEVDYMVALEKMEAARNAHQLRRGAVALIGNRRLAPLSVSIGASTYPEDAAVSQMVMAAAGELYWVDCEGLARRLGNSKVVNVIMVGFLSHLLTLSEQAWQQALEQYVPERFRELNQRAFAAGRAAAAEATPIRP